jgi:hypothetical protein
LPAQQQTDLAGRGGGRQRQHQRRAEQQRVLRRQRPGASGRRSQAAAAKVQVTKVEQAGEAAQVRVQQLQLGVGEAQAGGQWVRGRRCGLLLLPAGRGARGMFASVGGAAGGGVAARLHPTSLLRLGAWGPWRFCGRRGGCLGGVLGAPGGFGHGTQEGWLGD